MKRIAIALIPLAILLFASSHARSEPSAVSTNTLRDPFWPVGFSPMPKELADLSLSETRIRKNTHWPELKLQGISRTAKGVYIAIVNGIGLVEAGDTVSMNKGMLVYSWRINDITAQGISRTRLDVRERKTALQK